MRSGVLGYEPIDPGYGMKPDYLFHTHSTYFFHDVGWG